MHQRIRIWWLWAVREWQGFISICEHCGRGPAYYSSMCAQRLCDPCAARICRIYDKGEN